MYSNDEIMEFVSIVAETTDPDKIILYGSYAYGLPHEKSDIDLLVIKNDKELTIDEETEIAVSLFKKRKHHKVGAHYDVCVRTDNQAHRIAERGGALFDALQKGMVVYERSH